MQYSELKQTIKSGERLPDYYEQLLLHSSDILLDISLLGQVEAANQLGLTQAKLSTMKPLFIAFHNIVTPDTPYAEPSKEELIAKLNKGEQ